MANPFLTLGGLAVGVIVAGIGILQVPGWVASAQDAAAIDSLSNIHQAQVIRNNTGGGYTGDWNVLSGGSSLASLGAFERPVMTLASGDTPESSFTLAYGVTLADLGANTAGTEWCAIVQSASGNYFAASQEVPVTKKALTAEAAATSAKCTSETTTKLVNDRFSAEIDMRYRTPLQAFDLWLSGSPDGTIDWGDGSEPVAAKAGLNSHMYAEAKAYTVTLKGTFPQINFTNQAPAQHAIPTDAVFVTKVTEWGATGTVSAEKMFYGSANLTHVATPPAGITDMSEMFRDAGKFNQPINDWDVSQVTDMNGMFNYAHSFNQPLNAWKMGKVEDLTQMFYRALEFNQPIGDWDVSSAKLMHTMFSASGTDIYYGNYMKFNQDISKWNVSGVTDMSGMFTGAKDFNQDLGGWDVANVKQMSSMFAYTSFNSPLAEWKTLNVKNMSNMFEDTPFNHPIEKWNVSAVTSMNNMFKGSEFNQPLGQWNVSAVRQTNGMFQDSPFNQPLDTWVTGSNNSMIGMFAGTPFNHSIDKWNVANVYNMSSMFRDSSYNQPLTSWNTKSVQNMTEMFSNSKFNQNVSSWDVRKVTEFESFGPNMSAENIPAKFR